MAQQIAVAKESAPRPICARLAMRIEGDYWNAYLCPEANKMKNAVLIGSMHTSMMIDAETRRRFMMAMSRGAGTVASKVFRAPVTFNWRDLMGEPEDPPAVDQ